MNRIVYSILLLFICRASVGQEMILPLQINPVLASEQEDVGALKSAKTLPKSVRFDLDSSPNILIDDFSYNSHRPRPELWKDRSVYINRSFPINPVTIGVATFDGLDSKGYPYNFITPTSYGPCDTLTSLPINLGSVDWTQYDPVYLTFYYQPQGINPFANSTQDSISLEFYLPNKLDTITITNSQGQVIGTKIDTVPFNEWVHVWGQEGYDLSDKSCNGAFRFKTLAIPPNFYQDSFQFRYTTFGNTSGSVDHWHLDFVVLSSDLNKHVTLSDYSFTDEIESLIKEYESMPWFHYVGNESRYTRTQRVKYKIRNTFSDKVELKLMYRARDAQNVQIDSITVFNSTPINAKTCDQKNMPLDVFPADHPFLFPASSAPANSTTYFIKKTILERTISTGASDLFPENNQVDQYQVFGSYYAYDDGSAEAGYGVKSDKGKVAVKFIMPPNMADTLTALYMHFNPVVFDRSEERFRITVWADNKGEPGDIIYQNDQVNSPEYLKTGVNYMQKMKLDQPLLVSDTFYIGYQKITEDVLNIGYDLNRDKSDRLFYSIGGAWVKSSVSGTVPPGALMIRPAFRNVDEPSVGVIENRKVEASSFQLYPNPANNFIRIALNAGNENQYRGEIYSLDGKMVHSFNLQYQTEIDINRLTNGMYILRLIDSINSTSMHSKFLVAH